MTTTIKLPKGSEVETYVHSSGIHCVKDSSLPEPWGSLFRAGFHGACLMDGDEYVYYTNDIYTFAYRIQSGEWWYDKNKVSSELNSIVEDLQNNTREIQSILYTVLEEVSWAESFYPAHPTLEHSVTVIRREFDELMQEVDKNKRKGLQNPKDIYTEAIQVAAMAVRLIKDGIKNGDVEKTEITHGITL